MSKCLSTTGYSVQSFYTTILSEILINDEGKIKMLKIENFRQKVSHILEILVVQ